MKVSIFTGAVLGIVTCLILGFVALVRMAQESSRETSETFKQACEATGGKPVWNFKHWECLK